MQNKRFILLSSTLYVYLALCLIPLNLLLLRAFIAFPALFIIPGFLLLLLLKNREKCTIFELVVEGFLISTLLIILVTYLFYILAVPLMPQSYAVFYTILCSPLILFIYKKKDLKHLSNIERYIVRILIFAYVLLFLVFFQTPRYFTPDETSYIFKAYLFVTTGTFFPTVTGPHETTLQILFLSRTFWIMLLASYIASTGISPYFVGLLTTNFFVMLSLIPSLILNKKKENLLVYSVILLLSSPILLVFSDMVLNDLTIAFYIALSSVYFIKSFSFEKGILQISIKKLLLTLLLLLISILIKPNILIVGGMWLALIYLMVKYKFYRTNKKNKIVFFVSFLSIVLYELLIDIPYVIAVWFLRNPDLGAVFRKFIVVSFAERILSIFITPWWNPTRKTIFYLAPIDLIKRFYRLLMPESYTLIISAIVLATSFLLIAFGKIHLTLEEKVLTLVVFFSFWSFFFFTYAFFGDIPRYSLWMAPLWVTLSLMIIDKLLTDTKTQGLLLSLIWGSSLIVIVINIIIQNYSGGIIVGYGVLTRRTTYPILLLQFGLISFYFYFVLLKNKSVLSYVFKLKFTQHTVRRELKIANKTIFRMILIVLLLSNLYFSYVFINSNIFFKEHNILTISSEVNALGQNGNLSTLVFANNYIYLRPYLSTQVIRTERLLPPPDTLNEWTILFNTAPIGTTFVVSNDKDTTWYGYGDYYLNHFVNSDIITPPYTKPGILAKLKLSDTVLDMPFDDANETYVPDHSTFKNNGINEGASVVDGYYGKALVFNGAAHIMVPNSESLVFNESLSISFLAFFKNISQGKVMLLSKGNALSDGTFSIFLYHNDLLFYVGNVGGVRFSIEPYLQEWHHYVFSYDGKTVMAFVDGYPIAQNKYLGKIRNTIYNLTIGEPAYGKSKHFAGLLDELQISKSTINYTKLVQMYYSAFALKQKEITFENERFCKFYTLFRNDSYNTNTHNKDVNINVSNIYSGISSDLTWTLNLTISVNKPLGITLLISTDRFTKVHYLSISYSNSNVSITYSHFNKENNTINKYWYKLSVVNVILISDGQIVYQKSNLTHFDFGKYLMYFSLIVFTSLLLYLALIISSNNMKSLLGHITTILRAIDFYKIKQNCFDMFLNYIKRSKTVIIHISLSFYLLSLIFCFVSTFLDYRFLFVCYSFKNLL